MGITVRYSGQRFGDLKLTDREMMRELGLLARERIIRRTLSGLDETGRPFAPYSADYRATKAKEFGSASPVNLQVSGRMLQGLILLEVTDTSVTLGFKD
jgi:hypothetical protein